MDLSEVTLLQLAFPWQMTLMAGNLLLLLVFAAPAYERTMRAVMEGRLEDAVVLNEAGIGTVRRIALIVLLQAVLTMSVPVGVVGLAGGVIWWARRRNQRYLEDEVRRTRWSDAGARSAPGIDPPSDGG